MNFYSTPELQTPSERRLTIALLALAIGALFIQSCSGSSTPTILAIWVQLVPDEVITSDPKEKKPQAEIRLISGKGSKCEDIHLRVDAWSLKFISRDNPAPINYPVTICEALVPRNQGGKVSKLPKGLNLTVPTLDTWSADEIVVMADTGCRNNKDQDCDTAWPFARIAEHAAKNLTNRSQALVIHLGDSFYRKSMKDENGEDDWDSWKNDFFRPAQPLLSAAPWIMVRGNHENCFDKGGRGWYLFFDRVSQPCPSPTQENTTPYALDVAKTLRLVVMDSADTFPGTGRGVVVEKYQKQFEEVRKMASTRPGQVWLLSHVPIWGVEETDTLGPVLKKGTAILNDAVSLPPGDIASLSKISAVISGDLHFLQWVDPTHPRATLPIQLIAGHGGVNLDFPTPWTSRGKGPTRDQDLKWDTAQQHGYLKFLRGGKRWEVHSLIWQPGPSVVQKLLCELPDTGTRVCHPP